MLLQVSILRPARGLCLLPNCFSARTSKKRFVFVGLIPDMKPGVGHLPYTKESARYQKMFNGIIEREVRAHDFVLVDTTGVPPEGYADAVHFTDEGCMEIADRFANAILKEAV
jgi:hypothetical protein